MARGRNHRIRAEMCRLDGPFHATPTLDHGPFEQSTFKDFIPSHDALAAPGHVGSDFIDERRLKFRLVVQPQTLHLRLAFGALCPSNFGHFIAPNVNDLGWKQLTHLIQHRLQEGHGGVVSGAIHILEHPPIRRNRK